jgi:hypothetical protein
LASTLPSGGGLAVMSVTSCALAVVMGKVA